MPRKYKKKYAVEIVNEGWHFINSGKYSEGWHFLKSGNYQDAITLFSQIKTEQQEMVYLLELGSAYILANNATEAIKELENLRTVQSSPISLPVVGVALWAAGRYEDACHYWNAEIADHRCGLIEYTDDGGGVMLPALLWWASTHPLLRHWREVAEDEIRRLYELSKQDIYDPNNFLGAVAGFLLGDISQERLFECAKSPYTAIEHWQTAQIHFYLSGYYMDKGDSESYRQQLTTVRQYEDLYLTAEYLLAYIAASSNILLPTNGGERQ